MSKFKLSTGLMLGGIASAVGLLALLSDKKNRHKLENKSSKLLDKTSDMINDITSGF